MSRDALITSLRTRYSGQLKDDDGFTRYKIRYSLESFTIEKTKVVKESLQDLSDDVCINFLKLVSTFFEPFECEDLPGVTQTISYH